MSQQQQTAATAPFIPILVDGEPILDTQPRPAFRISAEDILFSIKQQFDRKELAFRELGQNACDAQATRILVDHDFSPETGQMTCRFLDNGQGMSLDVIRNHYFRLFDSSKENVSEAIGFFSAGRIAMFCYEPDSVTVLTRAEGHPGYELQIDAKLAAELYEIDPEDAASALESPHGTLVTLVIPMTNQDAWIAEVKRINQCIEQTLCWVRPQVTITEVER